MTRAVKIAVTLAVSLIVFVISGIVTGIYYLTEFQRGARLVNESYASELRGDYDIALKQLDQALQHKLTRYNSSIAHQNRGVAYNSKWKFDDAIREYTEAINLNPKSTEAYLGRALAHGRKGQSEKAIEDQSKTIQLDSNSYAAYYGRGFLFLQNNKPDRALADFDEAVRCNPNSADPLIMRGLCYMAKNDLDHALASFDGAILVDPKSAMAYMQRAQLYLHNGEREKGDRDRDHARSLNSNIEQASNDLASSLSEKLWAWTNSTGTTRAAMGYRAVFLEAKEASTAGDFDRAIKLYDAVLAMEISAIQASPAFMNRANAYRAKGDPDRALLDYDQALRLNPDNADAYVDRGSLLKQKGKQQAAMEDYAAAIRLNPNQWEAYFNRAADFRDEGRLDEGIADLSKTIELNPQFAGGYINRAAIYLGKGEIERAIDDYGKAIDVDPNSVGAYIGRATARLRKKQYAQAGRDLEKVPRLNPKHLDAALNSLAWFRAVCPEASLRDGRKAVEAATKACELKQWKDWRYIDTLAAAYAEYGDFPKAVQYQKQALQFAQGPDEIIEKAKQRLSLYEQHKPCREQLNQ